MITHQVIGGIKTAEMLKNMPLKVLKEVATVVREKTTEVLSHAKQLVSGKVLRNQTGTLRRKLNIRFEESKNAVFGLVGIKLSYAAAHEFGSTKSGIANVREHLRKTKSGNLAKVKAHSRNWKHNLPERSFLRRALKDLEPEIIRAIRNAIHERQ